jgi:hypothetical protein
MTDSWLLKVNRAEKHLQDFNSEASLYVKKHAYRATRTTDTKCKEHPDCWRYHLEVTERPDDNLAVILGDVTHNLRSALDHLAVAIAPPKRKYNAFFPIISENIEYGFDVPTKPQLEARNSFDRAVEGMPADAVAIIQRAQPYYLGPQTTKEVHLLGVLSRLDNADKHRDLIVLAPGVTNMRATFSARRFVQRFGSAGDEVVEHGAQVVHVTTERLYPPIRETEVDVKVHGAPHLTVEVGLGPADALPADWATDLIDRTRQFIKTLDPYVRRPKP